ncbi:MAG: hypothetical protein LBR91_00075 [Puniceicoccales bacterium]|nr:hypothetical protein [Puniceicoccales bacterium]
MFFVTLTLLAICEVMILRHCIKAYSNRVVQEKSALALRGTLKDRRRRLPSNHMEIERRMKTDLLRCKDFTAKKWPKMSELSYMCNSNLVPPNDVAAFFEISNFLTWAKETCDSMDVEFDPFCSFGFKDRFEKKYQPLDNEILDIHTQKEQLKLILSYLIESRSSYLKIISVERGDDSQSTYFDNDDVFLPEVKRFTRETSHIYRIKFVAFTNTFRSFMKNLYENEVPVTLRHLSVVPSRTLKLTRNRPEQISECLASTFTIELEFLDIPQNFSQISRKSPIVSRKIFYKITQ